MPSGRRRSQPEPPGPVFFLDRGLGVKYVAEVIRAAGFVALPMVEVYPGGADQTISDPEWIRRASDENWIALTKDYSIIRDHAAELEASTLRVFALNNANITGFEMADRYQRNIHRIIQHARKPGPYVYVVTATALELRWPTAKP